MREEQVLTIRRLEGIRYQIGFMCVMERRNREFELVRDLDKENKLLF